MNQESQLRPFLSILLIAANCSLGSVFYGYSLSYMNVSLKYVDQILNIDKNIQFINGVIQGKNHSSVLFIASLPFGAIFGAFFSSIILSYLSRKQSLMLTDTIGIIGTLLQLYPQLPLLIIARILIGITTGLNSALVQSNQIHQFHQVPLYINEFTPQKYKGNTGVIPQLSLNIGILIAFLLGLKSEIYQQQIFLALLAPCLLRMLLTSLVFRYDPPNYYISQDQTTYNRMMVTQQDLLYASKAIQSLKQIYKPKYVEGIYESLLDDKLRPHAEVSTSFKDLFGARYLKLLIIGCLLQLLSQFCGINSVIFYSTEIFLSITKNNIELTNTLNLIIPITGILCAFLAGALINRVGRKNILFVGDLICFISLAIIALCNKFLSSTDFSEVAEQYLIAAIFFYIYGYGISLGPVIWVTNSITNVFNKLYIPEFLPEKGVCLAGMVNWIGVVIITQSFPFLVERLQMWGCFLLFSVFCFLGLFLIQLTVKEDKAENLEDTNNYSLVAGDEHQDEPHQDEAENDL